MYEYLHGGNNENGTTCRQNYNDNFNFFYILETYLIYKLSFRRTTRNTAGFVFPRV